MALHIPPGAAPPGHTSRPSHVCRRFESVDGTAGEKASASSFTEPENLQRLEALLSLAYIVGMGQGNGWDETGLMCPFDLNLIG